MGRTTDDEKREDHRDLVSWVALSLSGREVLPSLATNCNLTADLLYDNTKA